VEKPSDDKNSRLFLMINEGFTISSHIKVSIGTEILRKVTELNF
jgi:hypothetical protein